MGPCFNLYLFSYSSVKAENRSMRIPAIILFGLLAFLGCSRSPEESRQNKKEPSLAAPAEDAGIRFKRARVFLLSDSDRKSPEHLLAPIIVHETGISAKAKQPGWTGGKEKERRVYLLRSKVEINGVPHPQFAYCWRYEAPGRPAKILRMTLDSSGYPAIFEVFTGAGELTALYASRGLEDAAAKEQAAVLPGKQYNIEGNSEIKVTGLVEDGPVAMGPLVYVAAGDRRIVFLSCRCSPSRIDNADDSLRYKLITPGGSTSASAEFAAKLPTSEEALRALRIPRDF